MSCKQKLPTRGGYFDLASSQKEVTKYEVEMSKPDFWSDPDRARSVGQRSESLKKFISDWETIGHDVADSLELAKQSEAENDENLKSEIEQELKRLTKTFSRLETTVLFSEKYDANDAIIAIHAGTGGVEAQDWAMMLQRMYLRYCQAKNFATEIIDTNRGSEAGVKSVTFEVIGPYAYGNLKAEAGVHRLVRISPFDAEKMRHTSFALVEVFPVLTSSDEVKINDDEIKIETMRASGHGGQGVNTTDSAVRITHRPTGLTVKCQNERSQQQNKKTALKLLQSKLVKFQQAAAGKQLAEIRGDVLAADWGNQIRSYVLQPYKLVKDHRTDFESTDPLSVLDGNLDDFIQSYLRYISKKG
ncbi:MAG: peptide chain release factor 2 [Patescibacteria group bacterium]|nr:peptide chain release factor 2 [Patescibacteria group bacterium]